MRPQFLRMLILLNFILVMYLPVWSEEVLDNSPVWFAAYEMLPEVPTDADLDRCFEYLNERILLRAPDLSFVSDYPSHRQETNRVIPVNLKDYPLKRFSRSEKMPPPGFEGLTKREACRTSYKGLALQLLRARLICEGKMAEGEREMTLLEKAMLCNSLLLLNPWCSTEWPIPCMREVMDWYAGQCQKINDKYGIQRTINDKIVSVCDGFGITGNTFEEKLAKWEAIADALPYDHFTTSALIHWLVINCKSENILKDPDNIPLEFRNGIPTFVDDYVKRRFFKAEDAEGSRGDRKLSESEILKARFLKSFLWQYLDEEMKCKEAFNTMSITWLQSANFGLLPTTSLLTYYKREMVYFNSVVNYPCIEENRYQFELLKEGETGEAYFIGMHKLEYEQGVGRIETDSIYPILFWHTNCPYGAEMLNGMYKIDYGFAPSINRTDLFYWSHNLHFLNEEPDITDTNLFPINKDLEYDLTNEGRKKLMNDETLFKMYTSGSSLKTNLPPSPDEYDFPVVYKYDHAKYKIYGFMHYDPEIGQPGARFALCLVVITPPEDAEPDEVLICPTSKKYSTTIRRMGLSHYGDIVWPAAEFKTRPENMELLKWTEDYTTKLHNRLKEESEEAKKRLEAFKRAFRYVPPEQK